MAEASARIRHGEVSDLDSDQLRVCTERDFFAALDYDLARVKSPGRVVLFAPFLGHRAEEVIPRLRDCITRGVDVYVVTPPVADFPEPNTRAWYGGVHRRLNEVGVKLVFFRKMHQKLVFIDDQVLYVGGLNPLSHADTAEIMDRWDSKDVFKVHAEQVRLGELLSMWADPDDAAMRTCPRDEAPLLIVAPVTYQEYDPMFWGCSNYPACPYVRRFAFGPRRSGGRVCDRCQTVMRLERKSAGVWWVCGSCHTRRKVQEGETTEAELSRARAVPPTKSRLATSSRRAAYSRPRRWR